MAFWDEKTLEEMTPVEWEALCDGCGRCCLMKLEDEDSGDIYVSDVRCQLLDGESCKCSDYPNRLKVVPDCIKLTPENVRTIEWIPKTCAYRRIAEGKGLAAAPADFGRPGNGDDGRRLGPRPHSAGKVGEAGRVGRPRRRLAQLGAAGGDLTAG